MSRLLRRTTWAAALWASSLLLLPGCAHFRPEAGEPRVVTAGKSARFTLGEPPPGGAVVSWDPGDGSAPVQGPELSHAWERAGRYQVTVTVDGEQDLVAVEVRPRDVLQAIPAGVKLALAVPSPWRRLPSLTALAERFLVGTELRRGLGALEEALGASPLDPAELAREGIDPDEGIALVVFPEDGGAAWLLVGIDDPDRAMGLCRRILGAVDATEREIEGGRFALGHDEDGRAVAWGVTGGYAALRAPGGDGEGSPAAALVHLALAPEGSLADDPEFARARRMAPGDDLIFYAQPQAVRALAHASGRRREEATGALVAAATLAPDELLVRAGLPLAAAEAAELSRTFRAASGSGSLAASIPEGAVAFASLSVAPARLAALFFDEPVKRAAAEAAAMQAFGFSLRALLDALSGNAAVAAWFEPGRFLAGAIDVLRSGGDLARAPLPPALLLVELSDPARAREALTAALRAVDALPSGAGDAERFTSETGTAAFSGGQLRIAGAADPTLLDRAPDAGGTLAEAIGAELLATPGVQLAWLDVAGILDGLRAARPQDGADPVEQAFAQALLLARLEGLSPVRDLRLSAEAGSGGLEARLRVRLRGER